MDQLHTIRPIGEEPPERCAVIFPGQGAPDVSGLRDLVARSLFAARWVSTLPSDLQACVHDENVAHVDDAAVMQALSMVISACFYQELERRHRSWLDRVFHAGPSLGELAAAAAAGCSDWPTMIEASRRRGRVMQSVSTEGGILVSVFGLQVKEVEAICADVEGAVGVASWVSETQCLISGRKAAVESAAQRCHERSGLRPLWLPVSTVGHCELLDSCVTPFCEALADLDVRSPRRPFRTALDGSSPRTEQDVERCLSQQLVRRVDWYPLVRDLASEGVRLFVGIGPTNPLLRQIQRDFPHCQAVAVADAEAVARLGHPKEDRDERFL